MTSWSCRSLQAVSTNTCFAIFIASPNQHCARWRPRYTEAQKEEVRQSIRDMLDFIHKKEYFTIARDVRKSRFRPYMTQFLRFATEADRELCQTIRQQNVLILDDVTTSGSTLGEVLRTLRILNEDNSIAIFSLIGRRDLMTDINI